MLHSLRVRLLATMLIILLVALGTMAVLASTATTTEFERSVGGILRYSDPHIDSKTINIQKYVTQHRGEEGFWPGLQALLEGMQNASRMRYVIADLDGNVYVDSTGKLIGQRLNLANSKPFAAYMIEGEPMLSYFEPLDAPNLQLIQQGFTELGQQLITDRHPGGRCAGAAAGVIALTQHLIPGQCAHPGGAKDGEWRSKSPGEGTDQRGTGRIG